MSDLGIPRVENAVKTPGNQLGNVCRRQGDERGRQWPSSLRQSRPIPVLPGHKGVFMRTGILAGAFVGLAVALVTALGIVMLRA